MARKRAIAPDAPAAATEKKARDDFHPDVITLLAKRAAYICSNPHCHAHTLAPSMAVPTKFEYSGVAAHITGAAVGGPRYNKELSPEQRASAENGIFLCAVCATVIDKNTGADHRRAFGELEDPA